MKPIELKDWDQIATCFSRDFKMPEMKRDSETDEIVTKTWAFRGLPDLSFELEPAIERSINYKTIFWPQLERLISSEFKARARSYLKASLIPNDQLTWLALMQHYGVPTRLLDFTYSPFVALYFSIRGIHEKPENLRPEELQLWAVDAEAVNKQFGKVADLAEIAQARHDHPGQGPPPYLVASNDPDEMGDSYDMKIDEILGLPTLINKVLSAEVGNQYKGVLNRSGCVCAIPPPAFNSRLASQQGLFLINCADTLLFRNSLAKMMEGCSGWWKRFKIPGHMFQEIEERLLQMNIHEQSLFPDLEGLARFIGQKIRLQWE